MLDRSDGASILICSGVIERTLINIAYELRYFLFVGRFNERILPFGPRASSADVGVMPWQLVLEPAVPREVGSYAGEGIPAVDGSRVGVGRGVGEGILGIVAAVAV